MNPPVEIRQNRWNRIQLFNNKTNQENENPNPQLFHFIFLNLCNYK